MIFKRMISTGIFLGVLLGGGVGFAKNPALLNGAGNFGLTLETDFSSRDMKLGGAKERVRVIRQGLRFSFGLTDWADIFFKAGPGRIEFEKSDLKSRNRPFFGLGFRVIRTTKGGYFGGLSYQRQMGSVSKFNFGAETLTIKDDWSEQDISLLAGTKDLMSGPQYNGRFYIGLRFSDRQDDLKFPDGRKAKAKEDSSLGFFLGLEYSDSDIFRAHVEIGTGDKKSLNARLGLVF